MNKNVLKTAFAAFFLALLLIQGVAFGQHQANSLCPIMPGEKVKSKFFVDYQNRRIYLCCKNCVKTFKRNPEKYLGYLAAEDSPRKNGQYSQAGGTPSDQNKKG